MKYIKLTKGQYAIVDDEDFAYLNQFKWFYCRYAKRAIGPHGKQKQLSMHRVIMNPPEGMQVDHINGNTLDNRRSNLRICTPLENQSNKKVSIKSKSGYRGVAPTSRPSSKPWRSAIKGNLIGYFKTSEEAASAYNVKARETFGEFARLNKIC